MGGGAVAGLAHALDVDVDEPAQLGDELGDVHPSTPVDRGWVFAGEDGYTHELRMAQGWCHHNARAGN
ncbi:hypothetical protein GCM10027030_16050 [Luteococcus sediminum]